MKAENAKLQILEINFKAAAQKLGELVARGAADEKILHQKKIAARRKTIFDVAEAASKEKSKTKDEHFLILDGRVLRRLIERDPMVAAMAREEREIYLDRPSDRDHYGLPPLARSGADQNETQ